MSHEDSGAQLPEGESQFRKFWGTWGIACILMGTLIIVMLVASLLGTQKEATAVPPTVTAHSNCELVSKQQTVGYKDVIESVDTSCGTFRVTSELYELMEEGKVYNLKSTHHDVSNTSYLSAVTEIK